MGVEIERKFLVHNDGWRREAKSAFSIKQGYFDTNDVTVRIRIIEDVAKLTIKGATSGVVRSEWEYTIPVIDGEEMIGEFCGGRCLEKTRHMIDHDGLTWEVDVFGGSLTGLIVAEIELPSEETTFDLPDWVGEEVSDDPRYFNEVLVKSGKAPT